MFLHVGEDDAFDIKRAILKVASRFYSLGCALGLPASALNKIRNDNPHDSEIALVQVINTWLAQQFTTERFGAPSWRNLVNALAEPAGGNDSLLAKEVAEDHPGNYVDAVINNYHTVHIIIVNILVVRRKHPLEESTDKAERKRPCLQSSASETCDITPHSAAISSFCPNAFNSLPIHARNCGVANVSSSLPSSLSNQWINPSPHQYSPPGLSILPSQG